MSKKRSSPDIDPDDERLRVACERFAKQLGLQDVDELLQFGRELFPSQPTHVVFGEEADGKARAFLIEGDSEYAASGLLERYLNLLHLGADSVVDDPCNASFSAKLFLNCRNLRLLTRREVDAVNCRFNATTR